MSLRPVQEMGIRPRPPFESVGSSASTDADRRQFLKAAGAFSIGLTMAHLGAAPCSGAEQSAVPQVPLGRVRVSRLICGSNPFNAGSHLSDFVNREMRSYYTPEQVLKTLRRCEAAGVNCWQISGVQNLDLYRQLVDEGSRMHAISLGRDPADLPVLAKGGVLAVAHHGEVTDQLFKSGKLDEIRDFLNRVRDAGMLAGVSTHMPAVVDAIESKGWEPDYYMTCVYERNRSSEELKKLLGCVPLPVREVYLEEDPPRMYQAVRNARRTCLAFKILAAGRVCDRKETVEKAFREAYQGIKPTDAVIVGIYDRYSDQPGEDAALAARFGNGKVS